MDQEGVPHDAPEAKWTFEKFKAERFIGIDINRGYVISGGNWEMNPVVFLPWARTGPT